MDNSFLVGDSMISSGPEDDACYTGDDARNAFHSATQRGARHRKIVATSTKATVAATYFKDKSEEELSKRRQSRMSSRSRSTLNSSGMGDYSEMESSGPTSEAEEECFPISTRSSFDGITDLESRSKPTTRSGIRSQRNSQDSTSSSHSTAVSFASSMVEGVTMSSNVVLDALCETPRDGNDDYFERFCLPTPQQPDSSSVSRYPSTDVSANASFSVSVNASNSTTANNTAHNSIMNSAYNSVLNSTVNTPLKSENNHGESEDGGGMIGNHRYSSYCHTHPLTPSDTFCALPLTPQLTPLSTNPFTENWIRLRCPW